MADTIKDTVRQILEGIDDSFDVATAAKLANSIAKHLVPLMKTSINDTTAAQKKFQASILALEAIRRVGKKDAERLLNSTEKQITSAYKNLKLDIKEIEKLYQTELKALRNILSKSEK